ncbi:MAG: hypothetical protein Q9162_002146 [Coniocarpon cinnabarinum]
MLYRHTRWLRNDSDNLVSWTSSFFHAVQLAIYRQYTDNDRPSADSIHITIINTKRTLPGSFLPSVELLREYGELDYARLEHGWWVSEYLSQGRIGFHSDPVAVVGTVTLQTLIGHGLYELYPAFADESHRGRLPHRVLGLRWPFTDHPKPPTNEECRLVTRIVNGCSLTSEHSIVLTVTLLSLKPRPRLHPGMLSYFHANHKLATAIEKVNIDSFANTSEVVPEHGQFVETMNDMYAVGQQHMWKEAEARKEGTVAPNALAMDLQNLALGT